MIGGDLFHRFFLRFLLAVLIASLLQLTLFHLFQRRTVYTEWQADLQQEARWFSMHMMTVPGPSLARAWRESHSSVRLLIVDESWSVLTDSHPEQGELDLAAIRAGRKPVGYLVAVEEHHAGNRVVMTRPWIPAFPHGVQWPLVGAAAVMVGLVIVFLYPLVRSLSSTFGRMTEIAQQVSSGHFGKTVGVKRSDELGRLIDAFDDMSRKLAEAERLNTRLLHDVSHELRSPLGRIQVMAQTIAHRPEETAECIRGIGEEVALLDRLVGDLLQTARMEADPAAMERSRFSLREWGGALFERHGKRTRAAGIAWSARIPVDDCAVEGDPQRLAQAVGNLVDNAIDAVDGRDDGRIEVFAAVNGDVWELGVHDNGRGIPEAARPHVFRRFYRADDHRARDRGGVGLGLSLVRAIAEAHGGHVSLDSREGSGTTVTLQLPLQP